MEQDVVEVEGCFDCSFQQRSEPLDEYADARDWCAHPELDGAPDELRIDTKFGSAPPDWCPLRTRETVVRLRVTARGKDGAA